MYLATHYLLRSSPARRRMQHWAVLLATLFSLWGGVPPTVYAQSCVLFPNDRDRFGVNFARDNNRRLEQYDVTPLHANWYLDYTTQSFAPQPTGMAFAQMVRTSLWKSSNFTATVESALRHNPGTLWILGNEPDRDKQDGVIPAEYARFYHDVYHFLKERDASARVAVAGVVQSTPLRRRYLDMVLAAYKTAYGADMPVDVWTVHGFVLPENNVWGAYIPPGLSEFAGEGMQYSVSDHDSATIFQKNLTDFRQWMADRGYRNRPLLVTEYGILLSPLHGFPYSRVSEFMLSSFEFFRTATSTTTGYPADNNRLFQSWSWFSLNYPPYDPKTKEGQNGNLYEPDSAELLPLGSDYGNYVSALSSANRVELGLNNLQLTPSSHTLPATDGNGTIPPLATTSNIDASEPLTPTLTLSGTLVNTGSADGCGLTLQFWHRLPNGQMIQLESRRLDNLARSTTNGFTVQWQLPRLTPGSHTIVIRAQADNAGIGLPIDTVKQQLNFNVYIAPLTTTLHLPLIQR